MDFIGSFLVKEMTQIWIDVPVGGWTLIIALEASSKQTSKTWTWRFDAGETLGNGWLNGNNNESIAATIGVNVKSGWM